MTKTEIENKIHDLKRNIERCKNIIESCENIIKTNENEIKKLEAEKERLAFERVEKGLRYYCVGVNELGVTVEPHIDNRLVFSDAMFENNNYFRTKERAEEVADKINFLLKLERLHDTYCPEYKPDWRNSSEIKYYIFFDSSLRRYTFIFSHVLSAGRVYFPTKEIAQKVCDVLDKELEDEDM